MFKCVFNRHCGSQKGQDVQIDLDTAVQTLKSRLALLNTCLSIHMTLSVTVAVSHACLHLQNTLGTDQTP